MTSNSTTTRTREGAEEHSTEEPLLTGPPSAPHGRPLEVWVGDTVLVRIDQGISRPLIVAEIHPDGSVSGALICADGDHERPALRGWEGEAGAQIQGRPSWHAPVAYGRMLHPGSGLGQWLPRRGGTHV